MFVNNKKQVPRKFGKRQERLMRFIILTFNVEPDLYRKILHFSELFTNNVNGDI